MATASSATSHLNDSGKKPVVLVVDDSRVMRIALTKILKDDYSVAEAVNGEEAWQRISSDATVKCVFTDLSMPELDGFGLLERIRSSKEKRISELPVIIITGNEDDQTVRDRVLANGANDIVMKPFQSGDIKSTTQRFIGQKPEPAPAKQDKPASPPKAAAAKPKAAKRAPEPSEQDTQRIDIKEKLEELVQRVDQARDEAKREREAREQIEKKHRAAEEALRVKLEQLRQRTEQAEADAERERTSRAQLEERYRAAEHEIRRELEEDVDQFQGQVDKALSRAREAEQRLQQEQEGRQRVEAARSELEDELGRLRTEMMLRQRDGDGVKNEEKLMGLQAETNQLRQEL
ncbi:MAG: response regulator, partial [Chromatiales bacterium]